MGLYNEHCIWEELNGGSAGRSESLGSVNGFDQAFHDDGFDFAITATINKTKKMKKIAKARKKKCSLFKKSAAKRRYAPVKQDKKVCLILRLMSRKNLYLIRRGIRGNLAKALGYMQRKKMT